MLSQIDSIIRHSLNDFVDDVTRSAWHGREREAISLYAFGFLQQYVSASGVLKDATQIGIEVTVPSNPHLNPKGRVAKDLVLWREPRMTCWDQNWQPSHYPLAILEWKVYRLPSPRAAMSSRDIDWLAQYAKHCRLPFVGYAISLDLLHREFLLSVTRIGDSRVQGQWLVR
jgi:hypothetical protein